MATTARRVCSYDDWEEKRPEIIRIHDDHTLKDLVKILRDEYNLKPMPTEKICRTRLRSWGIATYRTKSRPETHRQTRKRPTSLGASITSASIQRRRIPRPLRPSTYEPVEHVLFNVNGSLFTWCTTTCVEGDPSDLGQTIALYHGVGMLVGDGRYEEAARHMRIDAYLELKHLIIYNPPGLSMLVLKMWPIVQGYLLEENVHRMNLGHLSFLETFVLDMEALTADQYGHMHPICQLMRALLKVSRDDLADTLSRAHGKTLDVWGELTHPRAPRAKHPEQPHKAVTGITWKDYIRGKQKGLALVQKVSGWEMVKLLSGSPSGSKD